MSNSDAFKYHKAGTIEQWKLSDEYHNSFLIAKDAELDSVRENCVAKGLPDIAVSAAQGKFLHLLGRSVNAERVLEVGTLGGYSTVWFARALPAHGKVVTLELSEHHAEVAKENFKLAGVADKVEVVVGPAGDSIKKLEPSFDVVFIDADKDNNVLYYHEAKRLVRKGGIIIVDNVVWAGSPAFPEYSAPSIDGIRSLLKAIKGDPDVDATTIATVGERGYDGFLYAVRN